LQGPGLPVLALGDIEDHSMGIELRRGIAFHRSRGVVLKGRGGELARRLRLPNVADPRLGVPLQLSQRNADAIAVRLTHPIIAANQRSQ